ncbi:MAG: insulinase family protein [Paludibacteraceae bacterium]|nr:insulinase family protein [Paludibacteraceae bacterium]MBQ2520245.1 insulinase family protein [Paludibacteraceae bacterium]MBQ4017773.1 insulinase family protein [Paludibacteraceae bacterium]
MKKLLLNIMLLCAAMTLTAQEAPEKLPLDSAVRYGKLDNGLTYYIRHNEQPKQRAEFHIAQCVGAILEEDHQNGLAHFLEHMAFNGTQHFPGKGIINYFESIGVTFGGNINAYTSLDETVYRLSDVPTYREGIVDSALLVMHDWSCGLLLLPDEIDAERGVIREEWRTGRTARRRIWKQMQAAMYPGSQYAIRDVIGDTAVINNFEYQAIRDYYHKWYGPDNQAIIVVGDINVDSIEAKIKALWAEVPRRANYGERPIYTVNHNDKPLIAIVTDPEAEGSRITLQYKFDQLPELLQSTAQEYTLDLVRELACDMLNNRFSELALDPNASFTGAGAFYGEAVKQMDAFYGVIIPKEGRETEAYNDLLFQLEKMHRYGFTSAELERVKAEKLSQMEKYYNERNTRKNYNLARECIFHFLDGDAMPGAEWEYEYVQATLPLISLEAVNTIAKALTHANPTIAISAPEKEGVNIPSEETILASLAGLSDLAIEAPVEEAFDATLVKKAPHKGKIKSVTRNEELGMTEWVLSNGIKVAFRPTEFKADEILMRGFSRGGLSLVKTEDLPSALAATAIIEYSGLGRFNATQLEKALTGKTVSIGPSISENFEMMRGSSSVKDLETMLQLTYLYFTAPRRDEQAYETFMALMRNQLTNRDKNPKNTFSDSIQVMTTNHSDRAVIFDMQTLERVSLDKALEVYKARFANPADFTFVFVGNIDPNDPKTQELICTWLGGLKTKKKGLEEVMDHQIKVIPGVQKNYFTRTMETTTASNYIQYTSYDIPYTLSNDLHMEVIGRILDRRYLESIREREGGSYGVSTYGYIGILPSAYSELVMRFDTDPNKQTRLMEIIHEEVETILRDGPLPEDLQKEKEAMLKEFQEDLETNSYWRTVLYMYYMYDINYIRDYQEAVEAITGESVQAMLQQLVQSGNVLEVVMFPDEQ